MISSHLDLTKISKIKISITIKHKTLTITIKHKIIIKHKTLTKSNQNYQPNNKSIHIIITLSINNKHLNIK